MKTLMLLRHAKAARDLPVTDFDRPLKPRGERDANRLGRILAERNFLPGFVISSAAPRARQTAERIVEQADRPISLELTRELYLAPWSEHVRWLQSAPPEHDRVMVVGHNPEMEEWQAQLTGRAERMPPGALFVVRLALRGWQDLKLDSRGELLEIWRPGESDDIPPV